MAEVVVKVEGSSGGEMKDEKEWTKVMREDGLIEEDMMRRINAPGDGSCLFWAITMAYLLPVRNNQVIFGERFKRLFGSTNLNKLAHVQRLILKNNFDFVYEDRMLIELVTLALRNRVVDEIFKQEAEVVQSITLNDILHMKNEAFITDGIFAQLFQKEFLSEIHLIDLNQLKPKILNDLTIELINSELDKIPDKKNVQKFKFHCYLNAMKNCKSWGGELEVQAIQRLLQCHILIFKNKNINFNVNNNSINICLFNNNEVHFEFGLVKAESIINVLKNKNYRLAIDYIDIGVDNIDFQDDNGDSLLHFAALSDDKHDLINKLINQGADLNIRNKNNKSPSDVAHDLHLEKSKAIFDIRKNAINALHVAAETGELGNVQLLLSTSGHHELLDAPTNDDKKQTALHLAVLNKHLKVVKCLIEAGADVNAKDNELVSVLTYAVRAGFNLIVQYLIEEGADINSVDQHGMTPVHHAIKCNQFNTVQCLVENKADLNIADENNVTPLSRVINTENWDMVRYLLENGALLNGLKDEIKNKLFLHFIPESNSEEQFYKAIKLGNVEILKTLLKKHKSNNNEKLLEILASAYDKIKFCHLPINQNVCIYIENKLLALRFFSENELKNKINSDKMKNVENVKARISLVLTCIDHLNAFKKDEEVSETFLFIAKFIAQNWQILKTQLMWTYDVLPWEEMHFCLMIFISSHISPKKVQITNQLIIYKQRLLSHLHLFRKQLEDVETHLSDKDFDTKKKIVRETAVQNILEKTPEFQGLYNDFEIVKDVYSLKRIETHIKIACSVDLKLKPLIGQLAIERALQVIGECMKSTLDSPNMSESVQNMLINSAPLNLRQNVIFLRDSLSHVDTLANPNEMESEGDLYLKMQGDLTKLLPEITDMLLNRKYQAFKMFIERILECESVDQVRSITTGFTNTGNEMESSNVKMHAILSNIRKLFEKLDDLIETKTEFQRNDFESIYKTLETYNLKIEQAQSEHAQTYRRFRNLLTEISDINNLDFIKDKSRMFLGTLYLEPYNEMIYTKVVYYSRRIFDSIPNANYDVQYLFYEITSTVAFEGERVKGIDSFKFSFEKENLKKEKEKIHKIILDKIEIKVHSLAVRLATIEAQNVFKEQYEIKKNINKAKTTLMDFFQRKVPLEKNEFIELMEKISFKLPKKITYESLYAEKDDLKCQNVVKKINKETCDSFGTLVEKITKDPTNKAMQKGMTEFIKSFENLPQNLIDINLNSGCDSDQYFQILKSIENIFGIGKSDIEIVNLLRADDSIRVAVEMLMLNLAEMLSNSSLFQTNRLFLDEQWPILIGKNLRNYLAHGDFLIDILSIDHLKSIVSHFQILKLNSDKDKSNVYTNSKLIGKLTLEDISKLKENYQHKIELLKKQEELFSDAIKSDVNAIKSLVLNGAEINFRRSNGWTLLNSAAKNDNVELFRYLIENHFNIYQKDVFGISIIYYLPTFGSINILQFLLKECYIDVDANFKSHTLLHLAADDDQNEIVELLIENNANLEAVNQDGYTPIHLATQKGYFKVVETLFNSGADLGTRTKSGTTLLHSVAIGGYSDIIKFLINIGTRVNEADDAKYTPLHLACLNGHKDIVDILLDNKADVNATTDDMTTPLHYAANNGHEQIVELLLISKAKINEVTKIGLTALHIAALNGFEKVVGVLLKYDADVEARYINNVTALHIAASRDHHEVVKVLLEKHANVNSVSADDETALHFAALHNSKKSVTILIDFGADVNIRSKEGTALHLAAEKGHAGIMEILLDHGANLDERDTDGRTALHMAAYFNQIEAVELLLNRGAEINAISDYGNTPFLDACSQGHAQILELLRSRKANIFIKNKEDYNALLVCVREGNVKMAEKLISYGAMGDCASEALRIAAIFGHNNIIKLLLRNGAKVNYIAQHGIKRTALHAAAHHGHDTTVTLLIINGANANSTTDDHRSVTPLHVAACLGHASVADALLKLGAHVDALDGWGSTPLHYAAMKGHSHLIPVLRKYKTNVKVKNQHNLMAIHLAASHGFHTFIQQLFTHQADIYLRTNSGQLAMYLAIKNGHVNVVRTLIKLDKLLVDYEWPRHSVTGGNIDELICYAESKGFTPLHFACSLGQDSVVRTLCEEGADVNKKIVDDATPLHNAVESNKIQTANILIEKGVEVNAIKSNGSTPLHIAADEGYFEMVKLLIESGAEVNCKTNKNVTPLHLAAQNNHCDIIKLLLINKAKIDEIFEEGDTALHLAVLNGHVDSVDALLAFHPHVNVKGDDGVSPLQLAVHLGHFDITKQLIKHGADVFAKSHHDSVLHEAARNGDILKLILNEMRLKSDGDELKLAMNASDGEGDTPLMWAVEKGLLSATRILLECDEIDIDKQNNDGRTALHWAAQNGHQNIIELLINKADAGIKDKNGETAFDLAQQKISDDEKYETIAALLLSVTLDII